MTVLRSASVARPSTAVPATAWVLEPLWQPSLPPRLITAGRLQIGSDPQCDVHVPLAGVAPRHAVLLAGPQRVILRAWDPRTWINDDAVQAATLRLGDRVAVGPAVFRIRAATPDELLAQLPSPEREAPTPGEPSRSESAPPTSAPPAVAADADRALHTPSNPSFQTACSTSLQTTCSIVAGTVNHGDGGYGELVESPAAPVAVWTASPEPWQSPEVVQLPEVVLPAGGEPPTFPPPLPGFVRAVDLDAPLSPRFAQRPAAPQPDALQPDALRLRTPLEAERVEPLGTQQDQPSEQARRLQDREQELSRRGRILEQQAELCSRRQRELERRQRELEQREQEHQARVAEWQAACQSRQAELSRFERELADERARIEQTLAQARRELREEAAQQAQACAAWEESHRKLTAELAEQARHVDTQRAELAQRAREIEAERTELLAARSRIDADLEAFNRDRQIFREECRRWEAERRRIDGETAALREELLKQQSQLAHEWKRRTQEDVELLARRQELEEDRRKLLAQQAAWQRDREALWDELSARRQQLADELREIEQQHRIIAQLTTALESELLAVRKERDACAEERQQLQSQLAELATDRAACHELRRSLDAEVSAWHADVLQQTEELRQARQEQAAMQEQLASEWARLARDREDFEQAKQASQAACRADDSAPPRQPAADTDDKRLAAQWEMLDQLLLALEHEIADAAAERRLLQEQRLQPHTDAPPSPATVTEHAALPHLQTLFEPVPRSECEMQTVDNIVAAFDDDWTPVSAALQTGPTLAEPSAQVAAVPISGRAVPDEYASPSFPAIAGEFAGEHDFPNPPQATAVEPLSRLDSPATPHPLSPAVQLTVSPTAPTVPPLGNQLLGADAMPSASAAPEEPSPSTVGEERAPEPPAPREPASASPHDPQPAERDSLAHLRAELARMFDLPTLGQSAEETRPEQPSDQAGQVGTADRYAASSSGFAGNTPATAPSGCEPSDQGRDAALSTVRPSSTSADPALAEENANDDESISAYLARLLARTSRKTTVPDEPSAAPRPAEPVPTESTTTQTDAQTLGEAAVLPQEPFELEMKPRPDRETVRGHIESFREVANLSARTALTEHRWRVVRNELIWQSLLAMAATGGAIYYLYLLTPTGQDDVYFARGMACVIVAGWSWYRCAVAFRRLRSSMAMAARIAAIKQQRTKREQFVPPAPVESPPAP
jgi:hypothetical protein